MRTIKNGTRNASLTVVLVAFFFVFNGFSCSIQKLAIGATGSIIDNTLASVYAESDLILAESSISAFLKMLEGLVISDPGNEKFLRLLAEGYTGYALIFVEENNPERARLFYRRARDYGIQLLSKNRDMNAALNGPIGDFERLFAAANITDVSALFWTANAWMSYINLSRNDPDALIDMPVAQSLMRRVLELDETFYFGGAHLFFGSIYASQGIAGGDIKKAEEHFNRALELSNGKFLLTKVFYAKYYAVTRFDEELFKKSLREVLNTPGDILPEYRLINEVSKRKAQLYLSLMDEWF